MTFPPPTFHTLAHLHTRTSEPYKKCLSFLWTAWCVHSSRSLLHFHFMVHDYFSLSGTWGKLMSEETDVPIRCTLFLSPKILSSPLSLSAYILLHSSPNKKLFSLVHCLTHSPTHTRALMTHNFVKQANEEPLSICHWVLRLLFTCAECGSSHLNLAGMVLKSGT